MNNNNTTYKDSPLGKIPVDWDVRTLKDCCLIKGEYGINAAAVEYSEELPTYIRITDIDDDGNYSGVQKVSVNDENSGNFLLRSGDIVFARTGATVGKTYLYDSKDGELVFAGFLIRFRPNEKILIPQHLKHFTSTNLYWNWVKTISMRSGQPGINAEEYGSIKIPIPPLPLQKAIAHVLGLMDSAINLNKQLIAKKELQKKWLMQNLLTGKRRLKRYDSEWIEVSLGKLFNHIKNINDGDNCHSIMTISSKLGLISQEDKFDRVIAGDSLKKYTQLRTEDFAYNKGNSKTYPMGCIYQLEEKESALVPFVYICFSPSKLIDAKFYKHWFLANGLDRQLKKIITSGARGDGLLNVNTDDFFKLKVPSPQLEEQTAIAQMLQATEKKFNYSNPKQKNLGSRKKV